MTDRPTPVNLTLMPEHIDWLRNRFGAKGMSLGLRVLIAEAMKRPQRDRVRVPEMPKFRAGDSDIPWPTREQLRAGR